VRKAWLLSTQNLPSGSQASGKSKPARMGTTIVMDKIKDGALEFLLNPETAKAAGRLIKHQVLASETEYDNRVLEGIKNLVAGADEVTEPLEIKDFVRQALVLAGAAADETETSIDDIAIEAMSEFDSAISDYENISQLEAIIGGSNALKVLMTLTALGKKSKS